MPLVQRKCIAPQANNPIATGGDSAVLAGACARLLAAGADAVTVIIAQNVVEAAARRCAAGLLIW